MRLDEFGKAAIIAGGEVQHDDDGHARPLAETAEAVEEVEEGRNCSGGAAEADDRKALGGMV